MKICPKCHSTYSDESLKFCLADGAVLSSDPDATLINPTIRATPPPTEVLPTAAARLPTRSVPLPYLLVGLLALLVGGGAVALYTSGTKSGVGNSGPGVATPSPTLVATQQSSKPEESPPTVSNSFPFSVNRTGSHFYSTLPLLGGYEIAIPGDNQWHDTKITDGTQGPVNIQVADVSGLMQNARQNGAWYEYNFVARLRNNPYDHVLAHDAALKVRSTGGNVFIKVDVRQGDLY
jgi:hypothetical protein